MGVLRRALNSKLKDYIGKYVHINNSWEVLVRPNENLRKRIGPTHLHLDEHNNSFVDLLTIQRAMVKHYKFSIEGIDSLYCSNLVLALKIHATNAFTLSISL